MTTEEETTTTPEAPVPQRSYTTKRERIFEFGRPGLKHRKIVMKVLKIINSQKADYDAIIACAKARGISVEEFMKLPDNAYTEEEQRQILKGSSEEENTAFAEMMNEVMLEVLYATVKKAPFAFKTMAEFEEAMDDYAEAVELFPIATQWIAHAAKDMRNVNRPN